MSTTSDVVWVEPAPALADRVALPAVPLPVRSATASNLTATTTATTTSTGTATGNSGRFEPAAVALDVDGWLAAGHGTGAQRSVLGGWVAALCYLAGTELLDAGRPSTAVKVLSVGVRHAPDDPSLRVLLGIARWDGGHRLDGLAQLMLAVDQYGRAGRVAPMLNLLTARALSEAGRHEVARGLLEPLVMTDPRVPLFWDLVDTIDQRAAGARVTQPGR